MSDIEKEFFEAFGIKPVLKANCLWCELGNTTDSGIDCEGKHFDNWKMAQKDSCPKLNEHYPPITSDIVLGLEEIIFKSVFYDGIHIHAPYDNEYNTKWSYQLTYYKGGYYTCGYGDTRKEALLDQFMLIMEDSDVEQEEKDEISEEVKALFKC